MPLIQDKSKEAFSKNMGKEMDAGKSQKQALAIAYAIKRKKGGMDDTPHMAMGGMSHIADKIRIKRIQKMSKGGEVGEYPVEKDSEYAEGGEVDNGIDDMDGGMEAMEHYGESADDLLSQDVDEDPKVKRRSMLMGIMKSIKRGE